MPRLLEQALERIARGEAGDPQDESQVTEAGCSTMHGGSSTGVSRHERFTTKCAVGWDCVTSPLGALGEIDGETLQITKTRLVPDRTRSVRQRHPARSCSGTGERLVVQCGEGSIELLAWSAL